MRKLFGKAATPEAEDVVLIVADQAVAEADLAINGQAEAREILRSTNALMIATIKATTNRALWGRK